MNAVRKKVYTRPMMPIEPEDYFLNPPAGSAAQRASEYGIDLTLTLATWRLTPQERIEKLDALVDGVAWLRKNVRLQRPSAAATDAI
jgi:hypothetical protein